MDVSRTPIPLHIGLQYICRVHGLTPHRATGKCPYELFNGGKVISLFPKLTDSEKQRCEKNAVSNSIGRLRKRTTFIEGEDVLVYDLKTKLSARGRIVEVLGNNTYLADVGNGPTHISGDVICRAAAASDGRQQQKRSQEVGGHTHTDANGQTQSDGGGQDHGEGQDNGEDSEQNHERPVDVDDDWDGESEHNDSDNDDDFGDFGQWDQVRNPVRRYRRREDHLGPILQPRLRRR